MVTIIEDVANLLADMPGQDLPIYPILFPLDVVNCVAIFPAGGGLTGYPGMGPIRYAGTDNTPQAIDTPNFQVQVRYTDPFNAFARCEAIRQWLDENNPTGYIISKTTRSQPDDLTIQADLDMDGGPAYRFSVNFEAAKVRM
jgi:hypothetical protein